MEPATVNHARLSKAGEENSQQTQNLRESVKKLIKWIKENVGTGPLPMNCHLYPSGEFVRIDPDGEHGDKVVFQITANVTPTVSDLHKFAELITDSFLVELSEMLECNAAKMTCTSDRINAFLNE